MSLYDPPFPYRKRTVWVRRETGWRYRPALLWTLVIGTLFWLAISEIVVAVMEWATVACQS